MKKILLLLLITQGVFAQSFTKGIPQKLDSTSTPKFNALTIFGTGGVGFVGYSSQSATPSTPSSGFRLYANSSNALSWIGANGFTRTFDGTANTANRTYTLPDASGTFGLLGSNQTWSGTNTFSSNTSIGSVTSTEIGYISGVTSAIQTQLNGKLSTSSAISFAYPKGTYNASTNTPTLTATPDGSFEQGAFYEVTTAGTLGFAGTNFSSGQAVYVGDRITKIGTQWAYMPYAESTRIKAVESVISNYSTQTGTLTTGFYVNNSGTAVSSASRSYTTVTINANDNYKVTSTINGSPIYLAVYKNVGGTVIGYQNAGVNGSDTQYTDYYLTIPSGTTTMIINGMVANTTTIKKAIIFDQAARRTYVDSVDVKNKSISDSVATAHRYKLSAYANQTVTMTNGSYIDNNGTLQTSASRSYTTISATSSDSIKVTGSINGSPMYLAIYKNAAGGIISMQFQGTNGVTTQYTNQKLTIPSGTASIILNCMLANSPVIVSKIVPFSKAASTDVTDALAVRATTNETNIAINQSILSNYVTKSSTIVNSFYMNSSGTAVSSASRSYTIYSATPSDSIKVTSTINGSAIFLAIYKNSGGTVIGTQFQGVDGSNVSYTNQKLTIPTGTTSVIINGNIANPIIIKKKELITSIGSTDEINELKAQLNILTGKTVLFLGTSITAGASFATNAPLALGGTGINKGVGSSVARRSKADGSYSGLAWQNYCYSLSQTLAQKDSIINNWSTIRLGLSNSPPTTLDTAFVRGCSFERRLLPYLNGTLTMPDVFVFEHGRNDNFSTDSDSDFTTVPAVRNDRRYYIGAMNYLFDLIIQYNPYAKILILGHYENDLLTRVHLGQITLADYWNIPLCETWKKTGFSQQIAIGTQSLWATAPWSSYTSGQNTSIDMVRQRVWLPDGIHFESSTNGKANALMDKIVTQFLRENN